MINFVRVDKLFSMTFAERLKEVRLERGWSKKQLSEAAKVHHVQIGRYENKGAFPSADVLSKIANALGVSTEYLLNGSSDNLADNSLTDKELLNQFKTIEQFPEAKKQIVKELIDAFILKTSLQEKLAS